MNVVVIASEKRGVGKSSMANYLSYARDCKHGDVLLFKTDGNHPKVWSSSPRRYPVKQVSRKSLIHEIKQFRRSLADQQDHKKCLVVDTPAQTLSLELAAVADHFVFLETVFHQKNRISIDNSEDPDLAGRLLKLGRLAAFFSNAQSQNKNFKFSTFLVKPENDQYLYTPSGNSNPIRLQREACEQYGSKIGYSGLYPETGAQNSQAYEMIFNEELPNYFPGL